MPVGIDAQEALGVALYETSSSCPCPTTAQTARFSSDQQACAQGQPKRLPHKLTLRRSGIH